MGQPARMQTLHRELARLLQPQGNAAQSFAKASIACKQGEKGTWLSGFELNKQPIFQQGSKQGFHVWLVSCFNPASPTIGTSK